MFEPRHRADVPERTEPVLQPAPRHRSDRLLERLGAESFSIEDLMAHAVGPNPFRRSSR